MLRDPVMLLFIALVAIWGYLGLLIVVAAPWVLKLVGAVLVGFAAVTLHQLWRSR